MFKAKVVYDCELKAFDICCGDIVNVYLADEAIKELNSTEETNYVNKFRDMSYVVGFILINNKREAVFVSENEIEKLEEETKMKLELGNIVKLRGYDDLCIVLEDVIVTIYEGEYLGITNIKDEYDKNLIALSYAREIDGCKEYDIMAIYSCGINEGLVVLLNNTTPNWTWVRDEPRYEYDKINEVVLRNGRIFINTYGLEDDLKNEILDKLNLK